MIIDRFVTFRSLPVTVLLVVSLPATMWSQAPLLTRDEPAALSQQRNEGDNLPAEALGADDLIQLTVPYCTELSRTFRVGSDGRLALPLLTRKLNVAGMKPDQLGEELQLELEREHILISPTVSVSVLEYRSRPVNVMGAVMRPLTFQATGQTTLLDALARAGGMSPAAGGTILLTEHRAGMGAAGQVHVIPARGLLNESDPQYNVVLHGGEEIRVPEAGKIFVTGSVRRPGIYPMQADSETTVMKAVALSQGLDNFSSSTAYISRLNASGTRVPLEVPLKQIMARKANDIALKADDILYIPDAAGRRRAVRVLNQIVGFGSAAGTGMLLYR